MNIVFSTTRQWNPGDEFIMLGCINLLREHLGSFNPIIYNRNPQIRRARKYDIIKGFDKLAGKDLAEKFLDNSVKDRPPLDYADLVVFAGSPEWRGRRMTKLYESIQEFNLPAIFLGIGTSGPFNFDSQHFTQMEQEVIKNSLLITTRDSATQEGLNPLKTHLLPCPALFSSSSENVVEEVNRIGIIYGTSSATASNNISKETDSYLKKLYSAIIREIGKDIEIEFISHYIDELSPFKKDYPGQILNYSYDSKDYFDIYKKFDLVIGYRVHGIGISASMGIPGIMISHDPRAATVKGFQAEMFNVGDSIEKVVENIQEIMLTVKNRSQQIATHKQKTRQDYLELFKKRLNLNHL